MSLNCTEIDAIIKNIPINSNIKNFTSSKPGELYINYSLDNTPGSIFININDSSTGIFSIPSDEIKNIPKKTNRFSDLLNGKLRGGKIIEISQPSGSRVVIIKIKIIDKYFFIISRLWGAASNILLTMDDFIIVDCERRFSKRGEWPDEYFSLPEKKTDTILFKIRDSIPEETVNNTLYHYYRKLSENKLFELSKERLIRAVKAQIEIADDTLLQITDNLNPDKPDNIKKLGDLIMSNIYSIKKGAKELIVPDFDTDEQITIPLNPNLSPQDNAQYFYSKYKKIKAGISIWTEKLQATNLRLMILKDIELKILSAQNIEAINSLSVEFQKNSKIKPDTKQHDKKILPGRKILLSNNYTAYISRSAKEADEMLKIVAKGNDYWFHIRDNAGSHVVVKNKNNEQIPDKIKLEAAMLALHFSKSKSEDEGDIYFTRVKYLHKPNTNTPGLVFPTQEKNIKIKIDRSVINELLNQTHPN